MTTMSFNNPIALEETSLVLAAGRTSIRVLLGDGAIPRALV
jgi:hypothetical protein